MESPILVNFAGASSVFILNMILIIILLLSTFTKFRESSLKVALRWAALYSPRYGNSR